MCEQCEEHRERRMALERELAAMEMTWLRTEPQIRYVERKVYAQMPQKTVTLRNPDVKRIRRVEPGFFGKIGDAVDRAFGMRPW